MPTLTRNLFWGQGEVDHQLEVIDGHWPTDIDGAVFVVGPDKRSPGGHWLGHHGLLQKIHCRPDASGRIRVEHRLVNTPVHRLSRRLPFLFGSYEFVEFSPFGITNMANTNVQPIGDRLFVGYDAGRPVEVDPVTLRHLTPVGANDEWLQAVPGTYEPLIPVAAHPAPDFEEQALYFVNYSQISPPGAAHETHLARWGLDGPLERWRVEGMSAFDTVHDVKASRDHLVFADLPFIVEPETFRGGPRTRICTDHTLLWIVRKADLRATEVGGTVPAREVRIPYPTGHLSVDYDDAGGRLRVMLQHVPFVDFMTVIHRDTLDARHGRLIDPNYDGLIAVSPQPGAVGRYEVDASTGEVTAADVATDDRFWGSLLATQDTFRPAARARQRQLHYGGAGFDPDLISQEWWDLYKDETTGIVNPGDLPRDARPGVLTRFDLEAVKVAEVYEYDDGAFPHPPTFVPRAGSDDPDDGYVVVVVHQDGPKEVQVFDAAHIERGPVARATSASFNPCMMLHSCWMADRTGPRPSSYRIGTGRDVRGAVRGVPGVMAGFARVGRAMREEPRG